MKRRIYGGSSMFPLVVAWVTGGERIKGDTLSTR